MPKNTEKSLVKFNAIEYFKALDKELKKVTSELQKLMVAEARSNLASIPFKTNLVKLRGSKGTSDAARKQDVIESVISHELGLLEGTVMNTYGKQLGGFPYKGFAEFGVIQGRVTALEQGDFRNTHIGIYYEFGTGENAAHDGPYEWALRSWNPRRPKFKGSPILPRDERLGDWIDLGGNVRYTHARPDYSLGTKLRSRRFLQNVGEDLHAYYWFRNAFKDIQKVAGRKYAEALKKVNPFKFMKVKNNLIIGRKWS